MAQKWTEEECPAKQKKRNRGRKKTSIMLCHGNQGERMERKSKGSKFPCFLNAGPDKEVTGDLVKSSLLVKEEEKQELNYDKLNIECR